MLVKKDVFGAMPDGTEVFEYTIENDAGMSVGILTLGATIHKVVVPDKNGTPVDAVLGFDTVEDYLGKSNYQGATVGRFANRIGAGRFTLDGTDHVLDRNEKGKTSLHSSGEMSFKVWDSLIADSDSVEFSTSVPDGNHGFPGNVKATVRMTLDNSGTLRIEYAAETDRPAPLNLTNHTYFNLAGGGDILSHELKLNCSAFTPVDELSIPTGEIRAVAGTPFDFTAGKPIGADIEADDEQLAFTGGFDHNFVIDGADGSLRPCATASCAESGISLTVATTLPAVQFYAGNFLAGAEGKGGRPMNKRSGFCLETQFYPDSPNKPDFPSCIFGPDRPYESVTEFRFSKLG
ncbi:MAG: galactose mutarotase [Clostridia bacterium]|nr:galactose mutarotase [Clostridia bacterium]